MSAAEHTLTVCKPGYESLRLAPKHADAHKSTCLLEPDCASRAKKYITLVLHADSQGVYTCIPVQSRPGCSTRALSDRTHYVSA